MENFFNYITKPLPDDEVEIWFRINNIIPEKVNVFNDLANVTLKTSKEYQGELYLN